MSTDPDIDQVDEAADEISGATAGTTEAGRWFARAYVVGLLVLVVGGFSGLLYLGVLDLSVSLTAEVTVGWVVEYIVAGMGLLLVAFTAFMVVKAAGGNLVASVIRGGARLADAYSLPENQDGEE
jgi:hypothetical protein